MPRGGSKPGERRGGRKRGTPNRTTLERTLVAERDLAEAKADHRPLGKEVLEHYMHIFAEIADSERAAVLAENPENSLEHEARFERFARYAVDCAHKLAPYQSPTFRAIVVAPPPSQGQVGKVTRFTFSIFDRKRSDEPMIIGHEPSAAE